MTYSCYVENSEAFHVVMTDAIHDMLGVLLPIELGGMDAPAQAKMHTVLACADRRIHIMKGPTPVYTIAVNSTPTALCVLDSSAGWSVSGRG